MTVKVVLNSKNVRALLRSNEVLDDLDRRAKSIAKAAGPGFEADNEIGRNRARASVRADTREAMQAEAKNRALTRAIDAGRS